MPKTADNTTTPPDAASFKGLVKNREPRDAFETAFDPTLLAQDRQPHVTNEHQGRFPLPGGGSVTINTNGGESALALPQTVNGDLPSRLRSRALVLQGDEIPGSKGLRAKAHVLPLDTAHPYKEDTPFGPVVTVVYPGELTDKGTLAVPVVRISSQATVATEHFLQVRDVYRVDGATGDPVPRSNADSKLARAAVAASKSSTRSAITFKLMTPVLR